MNDSILPPTHSGLPPTPPELPPIQPESGRAQTLIKLFYRDVVQCLTEPHRFFESRFPQMSTTYALAFGIAVNWIAAFLEWLTRVVRHETLLDGLIKIRDQLSELPIWKNLPTDLWTQGTERASLVPAWITEVFSVTLSPFGSLFAFVFRSALLFIGVYLLLPKQGLIPNNRDDITYNNTVRIIAVCAAPHLIGAILGFLPFELGTLIAGIYVFALLMIAVSTRFKVSSLRSTAMIILPSILMIFLFTCVISVFGALLLGGLASLFGVFK